MRTIIAGSRSFADYPYMLACLNKFNDISVVLSGKAAGADSCGEKWAKEQNVPIESYPAAWHVKRGDRIVYDKGAGYKRNEQMAKRADRLIAFWDNHSSGTCHMILLAHTYKLDVHVFLFKAGIRNVL